MKHVDSVGIRELKARLSHHLRRVRAGLRVTVTERGRPIATIAPVQSSPAAEWATALVAEGRAAWSGGKPGGRRPLVEVASRRTVSQAVLEDRR
jgi:prevent-host-death family protein